MLGVLPQQPPTRDRPYCWTKVSCASAISGGVSGKYAPSLVRMGSPAFGMHSSGMREWRAR